MTRTHPRHPLRGARVAVALLGVATTLALVPNVASAGSYKVRSCLATPTYSTAAFSQFGTRGTRVKRACNPRGPGLRGLVTAIKPPGKRKRARRLKRRTRSVVTFRAPPGTSFVRLEWTGKRARTDCGYSAEVFADGPRIRPKPIGKTLRAGRGCYGAGHVQSADRDGGDVRIAGATRIVQRIICRGTRKRRSCSNRGRNFVLTRSAVATVRDNRPPMVRITRNGFARGWTNRTQALTYYATDTTGIRSGRAVSSAYAFGVVHRNCNASLAVPCRNGGEPVPVETRLLPDGTQSLAVEAVDGAYNVGRSAPVTAHIDRTAPARVGTALAGGEGWRRTPGLSVQWTNPVERDRAPIDGAYYQTRSATGKWLRPRLVAGRSLARLALQVSPGQTQIRIWRRDSAGNANAALASEPVTARYDPDAPRLAFRPGSSADPTRLTVAVTERTSGVARGAIEVSRLGSGTWQSLVTRRQNGRLTADVDDSRLAPGAYVARAQATDLAGNVGVATRPGTLRLPLRIGSSLRAGVVKRKTVRRKVRRHGKRRRVRRRITVLRRRARPHLGRHLKIAGRLTNSDGQPLGGQPVYVYSKTPISGLRLVGRVQTNSRGRYSYRAKATTTRTLTFAYMGTRLQLPSAARVELLVPAVSTIRASRRAVRNGGSVLFRGRVRSTPLPPAGKLVELQAHFRGRWRTFQTVRTGAGGKWRFRYRFGGTVGRVRYRFRALLPAEGGYPFETGRSRTASVTVRGR